MDVNVFELKKTPEGRKYLEKMREKYKYDIIQKDDPRYERIYGRRNKQMEERKQRAEAKAEAERLEAEERRLKGY